MSALNRLNAEAWLSQLHSYREEAGSIPEDLIEEAAEDLDRDPRSVWRLLERGLPGRTGRKPYVLSDAQIFSYYEAFGSCKRAIQILEARGSEAPTLRKFQRAINRQLTKKQRTHAKEGPKGAQRDRLFIQRNEIGRGVCLEMDHKVLDVLVIPVRGQKPARLRMTLAMCAKTRVISSVCLSTSPTETEVLNVLGAAMDYTPALTPGHGIPRFLRVDNAPEFSANGVKANCKAIGIRHMPTPPYAPHKKGKVERIFRTFDEELFALMPCYLNGPRKRDGSLAELTDVEPWPFERVVSETLEWVANYNYKRPHSSLDGLTPAQAWIEDKTPVNPIDPATLRRYTRRLIGSGRKVHPMGVKAYKRWFTDHKLEKHIGKEVELRGLPHDKTKVEVWLDNRFLTVAHPQDELTTEQKEQIMADRKAHSVETAKANLRAKRAARRRHQGVTKNEPLTDVTDVNPTPQEEAKSKRQSRVMDRMGLSKRRGGKRTPRKRGGEGGRQ